MVLTLITKITITFNVQLHCRHFNLISRCRLIAVPHSTKPSRKKEAGAADRTGIKKHGPPPGQLDLHFRDNGTDITRGIHHWLLIRNHIQGMGRVFYRSKPNPFQFGLAFS